MKIKILMRLATPSGNHAEGTILDVPDKRGNELIAQHIAEKAEDDAVATVPTGPNVETVKVMETATVPVENLEVAVKKMRAAAVKSNEVHARDAAEANKDVAVAAEEVKEVK